jgi:hypothetical protein
MNSFRTFLKYKLQIDEVFHEPNQTEKGYGTKELFFYGLKEYLAASCCINMLWKYLQRYF